MRKLFRMKYESCNGQCYEYDDVMSIRTLGLDMQGAAAFINRLVDIHEPACGNVNLAFRLDVDEELDVFVASFQRYGALDLFCDKTALGAMNKMIDGALRYYASDEYKKLGQPGLGHGVCKHGFNRDLVEFAIKYSGLDLSQQQELRQQFP